MDEPCAICGVDQQEHIGMKHVFTKHGEDPVLRLPDKKTPPAQASGPVDLAGMTLRLVAVLAKKGVLDEHDLEAVLRGKIEPPRPQ